MTHTIPSLVPHCLFLVLENFPHHESEEDKRVWEEEQKRLDREWYAMDEGYDDTHNPFSCPSLSLPCSRELPPS